MYHVWRNKLAKASARKWNSWFRIDHSLHATAGSIDEWVVIEYTGYHSNKGTSSTKKLYLSESKENYKMSEHFPILPRILNLNVFGLIVL